MVDIDLSISNELLKPGELRQALANLKSKYAKARAAAARSLGKAHNPEVVPALSGALKDSVKEVWSAAFRSLSEIGSKSAVNALIDALEDPREEVREEIARQLGMVRAVRAAEGIRHAAQAEHHIPAKQEMIEALGRLEDEGSLPLLASFLTNKNPSIRWSATWAISMIGRASRSQKAIDMLMLLERHTDHRIQHEAATALRAIGSRQI